MQTRSSAKRGAQLEGPSLGWMGGMSACVDLGVVGFAGVGLGIKTMPSIHQQGRSGHGGSTATCGKNL